MIRLSYDGLACRHDDAPDPTPGPGDAVVRLLRAGVALPDLALLDGRLKFRGTPGHEFVGVVERADDPALVGARVVGSPVRPCGSCERCRGGLAALCPARQVMGLHGAGGCWAQRFVVPQGNLAVVPKGVSDEAAVFAWSAAAAHHAATRTRLEGKPFVTIVGDGVVALLAAQLMAKRNASVRVLGWEPLRLERCAKWRIRHRLATEVGKRQDQDLVFEFTGTGAGLELALGMVRPRGRVMLAAVAPVPPVAFASDDPAVGLARAACQEVEIMGLGTGTIREGLDLIARGECDVTAFVGRKFPLDAVDEAIAAARAPGAFHAFLAA